jgi:hypothetical protein
VTLIYCDLTTIHAINGLKQERSSYLLEILELLVPGQPLLLSHSSVNSNGWEILFNEKLSKSHASLYRFNKDHNLEYNEMKITSEKICHFQELYHN